MRIQRKAFNMPDGEPNVRRCQKYMETVEEIRDVYDNIIKHCHEGRGNWVKTLSRKELEAIAVRWNAAVECCQEKTVECEQYMMENHRLKEEIARLEINIRELEQRGQNGVKPKILPDIPWSGNNNFEVGVPEREEVFQRERRNPVRTMTINVVQNEQPINKTNGEHVYNRYCHIDKTILEKCTLCEQAKNINYCRDECEICKKQANLYNSANDSVVKNFYKQRIKVELVKAMTPTGTPEISPAGTPTTLTTIMPVVNKREMFNQRGNFIDKFLAVTYTLEDTDMTRDNRLYLEQQLVCNFKRLTEIKSMPCKGSVYVIEYTKRGVPHLHGAVRLSVELLKGKTIAATDARFQGKNKITINGRIEKREDKLKMLLHPINVSGWIEYMKKEGEIKGEMEKIREGWEYIPTPAAHPF